MAQWRIDNQEFLDHNKTIFEVVNIADEDGNIINTFGAASNVIISEGSLAGYSGVHKYGAVFGTDSAELSTLWTYAKTSGQTVYPWDTAAGVLTAVSTSGSDTSVVTVQGLDNDYNFVEETFTLTGTTPTAAGSTTFKRVNRAFMNTATNVGDIQIKNGSTVVTQIEAGFGQTLQLLYTIPAGKTGYLLNLNASASKNQVVDIVFFQRPLNGAFRAAATMSLNQGNQTIDFSVPIKFTEKTDLDLRVRGSSNATISADFTLILKDNA